MRSRPLIPLAVLVLGLGTGCSDATGTVRGGEALTACGASTGDATFTALYADFFGPCGRASCSGQSSCHGAASQLGATVSGFVCGTSQSSCWQGMTMGIPADAGGLFPPIVSPDAGDVTQTQLWMGLHKAGATTGLNNMPCGNALQLCPKAQATYTFTADDLARIAAWFQQGAQNN
jgi:hypothetical protein